jgi:hypothetical protein
LGSKRNSRYDARGSRIEMRSSLGAHQKITRHAMCRMQGAQTRDFQLHIERDKLGLEPISGTPTQTPEARH